MPVSPSILSLQFVPEPSCRVVCIHVTIHTSEAQGNMHRPPCDSTFGMYGWEMIGSVGCEGIVHAGPFAASAMPIIYWGAHRGGGCAADDEEVVSS